MKDSIIKWFIQFMNCIENIYPVLIILLLIFVLSAIYLYKKKCEKNPLELFIEAIRTGNKIQIAGLLAFVLLLLLAKSTYPWLQALGYIGVILIILAFIFKSDPISKIDETLDDGDEEASDNENNSVLGE